MHYVTVPEDVTLKNSDGTAAMERVNGENMPVPPMRFVSTLWRLLEDERFRQGRKTQNIANRIEAAFEGALVGMIVALEDAWHEILVKAIEEPKRGEKMVLMPWERQLAPHYDAICDAPDADPKPKEVKAE